MRTDFRSIVESILNEEFNGIYDQRGHDDQHRVYEHIIRMELAKGFPNDPDCRTAVLLELLAEQVEDMQDVEELQVTFRFLFDMMAARMINDHVLFDTQGSA